jgi:hypothetical protein
MSRVPMGSRDPGAINRHHARVDQASLSAQPQHIVEETRQCLPMTADEPGDRHMIGDQIPDDHPEGHMLTTVTLDRS